MDYLSQTLPKLGWPDGIRAYCFTCGRDVTVWLSHPGDARPYEHLVCGARFTLDGSQFIEQQVGPVR